MEYKFKVFSLNVWGLPEIISKNKKQRIKALAEYLKECDYDVVCLQELWAKADFHFIADRCRNTLIYAEYFHSGIFGSGLAILSRWPIKKTFFHKWNLNGYLHMVHHGDWLAGKGVAFVQLTFFSYTINIYNSHFIAKYDEEDRYYLHRISQAYNAGLFVDMTAASADFCIFCTDLNVPSDDICYKLLSATGNLKDSFTLRTTDEMLRTIGTYALKSNTYSSGNASTVVDGLDGERIDYILYRSTNNDWDAVHYDLPLRGNVPGENFNYSDHEAIYTQFKKLNIVNSCPRMNSLMKLELEDKRSDLIERALQICLKGKEDIKCRQRLYLLFIISLLCLWLILQCFIPQMSPIEHLLCIPLLLYVFILFSFFYKLENNGIEQLKNQLCAMIKADELSSESNDGFSLSDESAESAADNDSVKILV